ncbi:E3 ubiquitin-protein ligase MBR2-like isoform X2 [Impatiens glandulifera]|uniref:E3 ubiquitin-protein ligase MBR2-like isoform X2 n=1 Tax=Impatiens glandulifera TaxID=253017 RepID=UPI001FB05F5A|nr:E3 ubiquitin-protein ligase MBR2-like isoform X2 [Impatiens glandulifera]
MGHRNGFTPPHVFEVGNAQNWNNVHQERTYMHPAENMPVNGINYGAYNPVPRSNGFASSNQMNEMPQYQPDAPGRSLESYLPIHASGSSNLAPNSYAHNASSSSTSSHGAHTFCSGAEGGFSNRGPYKRKNSSIYEGGSTNRYSSAGSSSDMWQENPHSDSQHKRWDGPAFGSSFRGNGISIHGEGSLRNVRRRSMLEPPPYHSSLTSSYISDHPTPVVEHFGQEFNNTQIGPAPQGRNMFSDANISSQENNHFTLGGPSRHSSTSADSVGYHNDFPSSGHLIPQNLHSQPIRGARSSYDHQRLAPAFRASSSNLHLGYYAAGDEGLQQPVGVNHPSRQHSRGLSSGWRNNERSGRTRISAERYRRSFNNGMGLHEQFAPEGLMVADRSRIYGSRNLLDQHRHLRLDVDNMSYEELLALGESIGHVNTGLSDNMINKSLSETVYCSSEHWQEELKCVICLEEYENMDEVGTLKACGHDFHVSCIKKWLSLKNMCPICKTTTLADHLKDE